MSLIDQLAEDIELLYNILEIPRKSDFRITFDTSLYDIEVIQIGINNGIITLPITYLGDGDFNNFINTSHIKYNNEMMTVSYGDGYIELCVNTGAPPKCERIKNTLFINF